MSKGWAWVSGIGIALCIIALMLFGRSERQAYWKARAAMLHHLQVSQQQQPDKIVFWRISR
jgi:hypothetical protein